ncbi:AAA family ATPase, partial [Akkermansiaceae bacterium]|nr:AAA family ATPase [Akkermansiaceae bacterium]
MTENEEIPPTETPDLAAVTGLANRLREEVSRVVFGQDETVAQVVAALLAGGHVLLEGKPGLGKTHMVLALASTFGGDFGRIQFTPDMMPSDITGFTLFDMKSQTFQTRRGPVFTNLLLADEINRAPAKTQAALLEVMQEQQVTIDGESLPVAPPFMCFATQNPIEQEGTYPLPEAQLDRFLIKVVIDYPTFEDELRVVSEVTAQAGG